MAILHDALAAAWQGEARLVFLVGEPGIGKTRLSSEFAMAAAVAGVRVLSGVCHEAEGLVPYEPFVSAIDNYARSLSDTELTEHSKSGAGHLNLLAPAIGKRLTTLHRPTKMSDAAARLRLFDAVSTFVEAAASGEGGALLILDDLQWADQGTLLLLQHLLRTRRRARLLVIGCYRDSGLDANEPLGKMLFAIDRLVSHVRIELQPLPSEAMRDLLRSLAPQHGSSEVVDEIEHQAGGNPFFAEELSHWFLQGQTVYGSAAAQTIPARIREQVRQRMSRLGRPCRELLCLVSAAPSGLPWPVLRLASAREEDRLIELVEEAVQAGLLRDPAGNSQAFTLYHDLVRQAIYTDQSAARRAQLHRRLAEAMQSATNSDSSVATLPDAAYQFRRAAALGEGADEALRYSLLAGEWCLTALAYEDAATQYEEALKFVGQAPAAARQRCLTLRALADALLKSGDVPEARRRFGEAATVARRARLDDEFVRAALGPGGEAGAIVDIGREDEAEIALLEEALIKPIADPLLKARVKARLGAMLIWSPEAERRQRLTRDALAEARRMHDAGTLAYTLYARRYVDAPEGDQRPALALADELIALAKETTSDELVLAGQRWRIESLLALGEMRALDEELAAYSRLAEETREPFDLTLVALIGSMRAVFSGHLDESERLLNRALEMGRTLGTPNLTITSGALLFQIRFEQSRLAGLEEPVVSFVTAFPRLPVWRTALATIYLETDRPEEARRQLEILAENDFADIPRDTTWLTCLSGLSDLCVALGDKARGALVYDLLLPYEGRNVNLTDVIAYGAVSGFLGGLAGLLERWDVAERHFEDALEFNRSMGAGPALGYARCAYARMLLNRAGQSDSDRAANLLAEALADARALRLPNVARLAEATQRRQPPPIRTFPDGLTPREVEVLQLIATGRTNRQMSDDLVLSERTVARHVANIYRKLGIHGKGEAAAYAVRHGLD